MANLKYRATKQSGALSDCTALKDGDNKYKPLEIFECENFGAHCVLIRFPLVTGAYGREFMCRFVLAVLETGTRRDHSDRILDDDSPSPGPGPLLKHRIALCTVFKARYEALFRFLMTRRQ
jgi:hypothetical protein